MKESFDDWSPKKEEGWERIEQCEAIIAEYTSQGLKLTLRQLYYQFVSRALIPNTERSYKNLGTLVSKARVAGLLDWAAIEDRTRRPTIPSEFRGLVHLVDAALAVYRLDRWDTQQHYAELWVEKEALAGVLEPLANQFHVPLMVNKGYSSQSAMYESAQRIHRRAVRELRGGKLDVRPVYIFYLGDHDPSGQDMVRDIQERLNRYTHNELDIYVECIALTTEQVEGFKPPPNPTKLTDSRASKYIDRHGYDCWEVDALDPATLQRLIRGAFDIIIDEKAMGVICQQEADDKARLQSALKNLKPVTPAR